MFYSPLEHFSCIHLDSQNYQDFVPQISFTRPTLLETAKEYLEICFNKLQNLHVEKTHAESLVHIRSLMMDRLLQFLFVECERESIEKTRHHGPYACLMAQGGYGRQEMNIYSDVDIMFLYPAKKEAYLEYLTESLLYILWDLDLDVGQAIRTVAECKKLIFEDVTVMTSLLDARYLAGDESIAHQLLYEVHQILKQGPVQKKFIAQKLDEKKERLDKFGGSVFVLEPNIKESAGTLRDLHLPLWIAKIQGRLGSYEELKEAGLLSQDEYDGLVVARNFLWRIRNELHLMNHKKVDLLTFQRQELIAPKMGFSDGENGILAVEKFMQAYYKLAYQVFTLSEKLIRRMLPEGHRFSGLIRRINSKNIDSYFKIVDGQIVARKKELFAEDPMALMLLFKHIQDRALPMHPETKDAVRIASMQMDENFRTNPEAVSLFRKIMNRYHNLGMALMAMHETGFLDEWMPEFKKLRCRVQHDAYHIYTIDTHSIFAVNELSKLYRGDYDDKFDFFAEKLAEVHQPEMLTLGLLLHDIGKGEGGNHSVKGAKIAESITHRLGYTDEEKKIIEFLILSHLMMPHLSQRRDLEDSELIIQFARSMANSDRLNMLLLLTWGDIRAVGPEAWTDWKGALLQKLYDKTSEVIVRGEFSKQKTLERVAKLKDSLISHFGNRYSRDELQKFLSLMPPRYFFAFSDKDVESHFLLVRSMGDQKVVADFSALTPEGMTQLTLYSLGTPQVFSLVTGLMLAFGLNVHRADAFQTTDGHILLNLWVTDAQGRMLADVALFEKIKENLVLVLSGRLKVEDLIAKRQLPDYLSKKPVQKAQTKIVIDNDVSAYYTVIDIYTHDRLGLLYDIIRTLNQLGCYVDVSKISTKVEQVTDVFYVKDIFGHKIMAADKLRLIKKSLHEVIEGPVA